MIRLISQLMKFGCVGLLVTIVHYFIAVTFLASRGWAFNSPRTFGVKAAAQTWSIS
jgi:putative flippase GtrA